MISFGLPVRSARPAIRFHAVRYAVVLNAPRSTSSSGSWKYDQ
ncbi:hypothetical protein V2I01_12640 [Micromonospora sp. BRA006-A]|nr:hypothetical protein [Micromonospora sp. BRA006-A]